MLKTATGAAGSYITTNRTVLDALLDLQIRESSPSHGTVERRGPGVEWLCACGLPLHYRDPSVREFVESVIAERGANVIATIEGRAFEIPRHYIALHGIADDIDPDALGFQLAEL